LLARGGWFLGTPIGPPLEEREHEPGGAFAAQPHIIVRVERALGPSAVRAG